MKISKYIIYALVDPRTHQWRYIGRSSCGLERPNRHFEPRYMERYKHLPVICWIKNVLNAGFKPYIEVLEEVNSFEETGSAEMEWIAEARKCGVRLTNLTDGGDGGSYGYKQSPEHKEKRAAALRGRVLGPRSAETKARIGIKFKGIKFSEERRKRLVLSMGGKLITDGVKIYTGIFDLQKTVKIGARRAKKELQNGELVVGEVHYRYVQ